MLLHLVRHGESTWNLERRLQGQTMHVPLTPLGVEQVQRAAEQLAEHAVAAIWTSDQLRATQTAEIIAAPHRLKPLRSPLLREQALGELEGRHVDELTEQPTPPGLHVTEVEWGGGESIRQVHARLREFCQRLLAIQQPGDEVVIVSHGDTLRVLLAVLDGRGHRDVVWRRIANAEVVSRNLTGPSLPDDGVGGARH